MISRTASTDRRRVPLSDVAPPPERAVQRKQQFFSLVEDWIGKHPVIGVGMALTLGIGLGCLIKRR